MNDTALPAREDHRAQRQQHRHYTRKQTKPTTPRNDIFIFELLLHCFTPLIEQSEQKLFESMSK